MRVADVANNSQASLIAQQLATAAQQQPQQNANVQFALEAQRAVDRLSEQVKQFEEAAERDKVRNDRHEQPRERRRRGRRRAVPDTAEATPPPPPLDRLHASEEEKGRIIDIEA